MVASVVSVEQYRDTSYNIGYLQGKRLEESLIQKLSLLEVVQKVTK